MALLSRHDLTTALERLGEFAEQDGLVVELLIVGGGVMVLEFGARVSTRDLDGIVINDVDRSKVRGYAATIARTAPTPTPVTLRSRKLPK